MHYYLIVNKKTGKPTHGNLSLWRRKKDAVHCGAQQAIGVIELLESEKD